jgi:hypothetical protein
MRVLLCVLVALYTLAKVFFNQFAQCGDGFDFVGAFGPDAYFVPLLDTNLHQVDGADLNFSTAVAAHILDGDAALKAAPGAVEERRGARVEANGVRYRACCFCHAKKTSEPS